MSTITPRGLRKIIHCDCDCFYAAVEMRDNPALKGKPVAVGGMPAERGVIAACNYEARAFGIHSAMPTVQAVKRCADLILLPVDMDRYRTVSKRILAIYADYSPLVEPLSLDEAYLDVTGSIHCQGSATRIAEAIRARVFREVGITVSAGVAPNKFLAKIASDWKKPDGCFTITPQAVDNFVADLPVSKIFGVGPVTAAKLAKSGIETCRQLQALTLVELQKRFGVFGKALFSLARGIDDREVTPSRLRKSVSVETTFRTDLKDRDQCHRALIALIDRLMARLDRAQLASRVTKRFVKIRFADFRTTTIEAVGLDLSPEAFIALCDAALARHRLAIRLLGVGVRLSEGQPCSQGDLFENDDKLEEAEPVLA